MTDVISITLPIFLLVAIGFGAVRFGVVDETFVRGLGFFVLNFAMPALILHALLGQDFRQAFSIGFVIAYGAGSLVVMLVMLALLRAVLRRDGGHAAIAALGGVASNSGFVGFPVASLAIGAPALAALPMAMLVENVLIIPLALGLAEAARQAGTSPPAIVREAALRLVKMPLFIAIFAGLALSLVGVQLPRFLATTVDMMSSASAACALFTVGGTLAVLKPSASVAGDVSLIVVAKLVAHPLAVATGFWLLGDVPGPLMAAGLIFAASPMLTIYPILGQRFGLGPLTSLALLAATTASFVTLTLLIGFLR